MSVNVGSLASDKLCQIVVRGMQEKKAEDIVVLDLREVPNAVSDFFVICSGKSDTQIDAIAESIEEEVYKIDQESPWHKEGLNNKTWVLIDYVDVVAHVFNKEEREFYNLESLWGDAKIEEIGELQE
jgi:ribosome-associated protein